MIFLFQEVNEFVKWRINVRNFIDIPIYANNVALLFFKKSLNFDVKLGVFYLNKKKTVNNKYQSKIFKSDLEIPKPELYYR